MAKSFPLGDLYIELHDTDRWTKALVYLGRAQELLGRGQDRDPARALGLAILDAQATLQQRARQGGQLT